MSKKPHTGVGKVPSLVKLVYLVQLQHHHCGGVVFGLNNYTILTSKKPHIGVGEVIGSNKILLEILKNQRYLSVIYFLLHTKVFGIHRLGKALGIDHDETLRRTTGRLKDWGVIFNPGKEDVDVKKYLGYLEQFKRKYPPHVFCKLTETARSFFSAKCCTDYLEAAVPSFVKENVRKYLQPLKDLVTARRAHARAETEKLKTEKKELLAAYNGGKWSSDTEQIKGWRKEGKCQPSEYCCAVCGVQLETYKQYYTFPGRRKICQKCGREQLDIMLSGFNEQIKKQKGVIKNG